jgi:hypothetical protein
MDTIILPTGDLAAEEMLRSISLIPGKGIMARGSYKDATTWIPETDIEVGKLFRDALIEFVQSNGTTGQPDWDAIRATKSKKINKPAA